MPLRSQTRRLVPTDLSDDEYGRSSSSQSPQSSFVDQLSFSEVPLSGTMVTPPPIPTSPLVSQPVSNWPEAGAMGTLSPISMPPEAGMMLAEPQAATPQSYAGSPKNAPDFVRNRIVIPNTGKKSSGIRPPEKLPLSKSKRFVLQSTLITALICIVCVSLFAVIPVDNQGHTVGYQVLQPVLNIVHANSSNTGLIAAQAATATAVMQDGTEYGANTHFAGVDYAALPTLPQTGGFVNLNTPGQCTYWADFRYHQLTGYGVPWVGNAETWSYYAADYYAQGWRVSSTPVVPSIIVLQGGVQHAYVSTGHVGVVESINADGTVHTSDWNIIGPGIYSTVDYTPGPGVSFVYHI